MQIDGNYGASNIFDLGEIARDDERRKFSSVEQQTTSSGDSVDISDEARRLYSEMIHKYDGAQSAPAESGGNGQQGGGGAGGASGDSSSSDQVENIKKQIQALESQLMALASQAESGGDMGKMNALQSQISALKAQLNAMQQSA